MNNVHTNGANGKTPRRRTVTPQQVSLVVERVEVLNLSIEGGAGLAKLLGILEHVVPAFGVASSQSARLARVEAALGNGNGANGHQRAA